MDRILVIIKSPLTSSEIHIFYLRQVSIWSGLPRQFAVRSACLGVTDGADNASASFPTFKCQHHCSFRSLRVCVCARVCLFESGRRHLFLELLEFDSKY